MRQYGGLDSGFHSVDSGSKRWSGNEVWAGCPECRGWESLLPPCHVDSLLVAVGCGGLQPSSRLRASLPPSPQRSAWTFPFGSRSSPGSPGS